MYIDSKRYEPAGYCIYCGSDGHGQPLTDEHIIPLGLGGTMVWPESSCECCRKVTAKIEDFCLRLSLGNIRSKMGLRSKKRKKKHAKTRPVWLGYNDFSRETELPIKELVPVMVLPVFQPPGILAKRHPNRHSKVRLWIWSNDGKLDDLIRRHAAKSVVEKIPIHPSYFARMIAKIAHGFALAEHEPNFTPLLNDVILGKSENVTHYVGNIPVKEPHFPDALHDLNVFEKFWDHSYLIVTVRLFTLIGAPTYYVVTGRMNPLSPELQESDPS